MWKTLHQSVQGTSHVQAGRPCQDSCAIRLIEAEEKVLILACSDGAGSAASSEIGSRVACDTLVELVAAEVRAGGKLGVVAAERASAWFEYVHRALIAEAEARAFEPRQLACTLLFAVLGEAGAAFGQVGDGAIVVARDDGYETVFWPQSGEYVNTTNFITDPRYPSLVEFAWRDGSVDEAALFSDGLQMLGLDYREKRVHDPFFRPMFQALRQEQEPDTLMQPLRAFLESPQLAERTDDDKTLILATRRSC